MNNNILSNLRDSLRINLEQRHGSIIMEALSEGKAKK